MSRFQGVEKYLLLSCQNECPSSCLFGISYEESVVMSKADIAPAFA